MMANKIHNIPFEFSDYVLKKYIIETGTRQGWLCEDTRKIIAAVSGGGDSMALMWLCAKFTGKNILVVHVNHGIRGSEADEDANYVMSAAQAMGLEAVIRKCSAPGERLKGESLETSARRLRLREICNIAHTESISTVLTGHNRDDLAETVMFNLLRGTGIRGSVGITESNELDGVKFCRPLLGLRREFLRDILRARGISWREDSTNIDDEYTRNFIRLRLFPMIEQNINASVIEHLAVFGEDMRQVREREDTLSRDLLAMCREQGHDVLVLSRKKLARLSLEDIALVIREAGRKLGLKTLSRNRCNELSGLIAKSGRFIFQWSGSSRVTCTNGKIYFEADNDKRDTR